MPATWSRPTSAAPVRTLCCSPLASPVRLGKALSTPPDFADGVLAAVGAAAEGVGIATDTLLAQTALFMHGSTVVDNTLVTRTGARTGLITTEGFEDTLTITRGAYGRWAGLTEDGIKHPVATDRAPPLVPGSRTRGVPERMDYKGAVLRELDEEAVRQAVRSLVDDDEVEALAVSFLWSFYNDSHERRVGDLIREIAPSVYVTLSSEIAPVPGEYERASTTVINAYAGQIASEYITSLQALLRGCGYDGPAPGDAGLWRPASGRGGGRPGGGHARMRPRRRRHRQPSSRPADGRRGHHRLRHGRHDLQGRRDPGRCHRLRPRADGRPLSLCSAEDRGGLHRRRRRQHRRARSRDRRAGRGAGERRRAAGAGLLRAWRQRADAHRCHASRGLHGPRHLPRRHRLRSMPRRRGRSSPKRSPRRSA